MPVALTNFVGKEKQKKNKLSRSMTRIIANFGRNFHSLCKNIKTKVFSESSL